MSEKTVQQNLDEMYETAQRLAEHAKTDEERQIAADMIKDIDAKRQSFRGDVPKQRKPKTR